VRVGERSRFLPLTARFVSQRIGVHYTLEGIAGTESEQSTSGTWPVNLRTAHSQPRSGAKRLRRPLDILLSVTSSSDDATGPPGWRWDPSLYAGSAPHYARGRVAYPAEAVDALTTALRLDGSGRLLDVGCGPGSLTLLLAPHFAQAVGVDADPGMLDEAARLAEELGVTNVEWRRLRAEELPADLRLFRVVTFAQSFHWMDRRLVAAIARGMLEPGGAVVHVHATTHEGMGGDAALPHPRPPREAIGDLVQRYLGPTRRAGQGVLAAGLPDNEDAVYRQAGFSGPQRIDLPGRTVERTTDEVVSSVYSLSSAAPHLFGNRVEPFDKELRALLARTSRTGMFSEEMRPVSLDIWR
jgi:SAM-dependent methyltransferase